MKQLNPNQKDELIEQYVNLLVDSMSMADLISYVTEDLCNYCEKLSDSELKEEISLTYDDEMYEELVDNITSTDSVVYNTNRGQDDERELTTKEQIDYISSNLKEVN